MPKIIRVVPHSVMPSENRKASIMTVYKVNLPSRASMIFCYPLVIIKL